MSIVIICQGISHIFLKAFSFMLFFCGCPQFHLVPFSIIFAQFLPHELGNLFLSGFRPISLYFWQMEQKLSKARQICPLGEHFHYPDTGFAFKIAFLDYTQKYSNAHGICVYLRDLSWMGIPSFILKTG